MMNTRQISLLLILVLLMMPFCTAEVYAEDASGRVVIGIAWRADTDSEFYTNIRAALIAAGAEPVLLEQVIDRDLEYYEGEIAPVGITADGYLTEAYAEQIKANTYLNSNTAEVIEGVDAVIFTGGEDIAPTLLAEPTDWHHIEAEKDYNATRDVSDYLLMSYCIDMDIPVMGFCRGMQMLATVSGAEMIQDIPVFYAEQGLEYGFEHRNEKSSPDAYRDYIPHDVVIKSANSLICEIFGTDRISGVPSWHHQAVKSVEGTPLEVTASIDTNGYEIVEAIERTDKSMMIGFQFHPEAAVVKDMEQAENAGDFMDAQLAIKPFEYLIAYCQSGVMEDAA